MELLTLPPAWPVLAPRIDELLRQCHSWHWRNTAVEEGCPTMLGPVHTAGLARATRPPPEPDPDADWRARAACRDVADPDVFFGAHRAGENEAQALCRSCPVQQPCHDEAVRLGAGGRWGGTSERQRRRGNPGTDP